MIGTSESNSFQGFFDGDGHTLTVNFDDTSGNDFCGPFRVVKDASIKRLHVAGVIKKTEGKNIGVVGRSYGTTNIVSCRSSVSIQSSVTNNNYDGSNGSFVGDVRGGTCNIIDCLFDGKMEKYGGGSSPTTHWGGFIGWVASGCTANLTNCLFNPAEMHIYTPAECGTFTRQDGTVNLVSCYYTNKDGVQYEYYQGTNATSISASDLRAALGNGWEIKDDKVVPILPPIRSFSGEGTQASPYLIASATDWNKFWTNIYLEQTYSGKYFKLTNDISIDHMAGAEVAGSYRTFNGTFDGDGHTITVNLSSDADWCAPFAFCYGATIQNLNTAGTITTSARYAGGVVGRNGTARLTMNNVTSSVTINSSYSIDDACHGGLVGYAINSELNGCVFTGSLLGADSKGCGGLMGWKSNTTDSRADLTNCVFAPAEVTIGTTDSYTFVKKPYESVANIINCYYTQTFGTVQGTTPALVNGTDNSTLITVFNGKTLSSLTLQDRTLYKDGAWNTLCLPFDVSTTSGTLAGDDVMAMVLDNSTTTFTGGTLTLNFTAAPNPIPAGTPFIIKWGNTGSTFSPTFDNVTIDNTVRDITCDLGNGRSITCKGTYSMIPFSADDPSILILGGANTLYYPAGGASIGACRAYFQLDGITAGDTPQGDTQEVKAFVLNFDGDIATGILSMEDGRLKVCSNDWYDMNGRRLQGVPTMKGIYLNNGRKVVIK